METLCNVNLQVLISQGFTCQRHKLMALLFFVLEAASFVLDAVLQIGGNQFGFRIASFVLSGISFLMTGYIAMGSQTDFKGDRIMIELAFSVVQLIMTCLQLLAPIFNFKFQSKIVSKIACIYPLVLAGTNLVLAYRRNELVQHPTPNTQDRDEEEGFAGIPVYQIHDATTSDNLSTVVDGTPDSRVLLPVTTQSSIMVNEELAFSVVQLIMTYLQLLVSIFNFEFQSNIACIYPLVLARTNLVLAYIRNELVQHPTPNTQERDEEEGFAGIPVYQIHDVTTSDNLSTVVDGTPDSRVLLPVTTQSSIMVNEEETARMSQQEEIPENSRASFILSATPN